MIHLRFASSQTFYQVRFLRYMGEVFTWLILYRFSASRCSSGCFSRYQEGYRNQELWRCKYWVIFVLHFHSEWYRDAYLVFSFFFLPRLVSPLGVSFCLFIVYLNNQTDKQLSRRFCTFMCEIPINVPFVSVYECSKFRLMLPTIGLLLCLCFR